MSLRKDKLCSHKNVFREKAIISEPLAHSGGHLLADHLQSVAGISANFSEAFEPTAVTKRWAYLAGLWHELGKYRTGFQRYLQSDNPSTNRHAP